MFDSDCALITGVGQHSTWNTCLVRAVAADLCDLTEAEADTAFGRPQDVATQAAAWSRAVGLRPDETRLEEIFEFNDAQEIFLGLKLFNRMLDALGLPAQQSSDFYEDA